MSFGFGEGLCFGSWTLDIDVVSDLSLDMGTWVVKLYYFYGLSVVPSFLLCVHSSPVTIYIFNCCVPTCTNLDCGPTCQLLRIITCCLAIFLKCATVLFKRHIIGNLCQWYGSTNFVFNSECLEVLNNCHVDILGFGLQLANSIDIVSIVTSGGAEWSWEECPCCCMRTFCLGILLKLWYNFSFGWEIVRIYEH